MDLAYPADAEAFRAEVREILAAELPPGFAGVGSITDAAEAEAWVDRWRATLFRRRLLGITVLVEELARAGVPYGAPYDTYALKMLANTLLRWGSEEQKQRFLPKIQSGEE